MAHEFEQGAAETAELIFKLVSRRLDRALTKSNVSTKRSEQLTHDRRDGGSVGSDSGSTLPTRPPAKGYLLVTTPVGYTWLAPGLAGQVLTMISGMPAWHYPVAALTAQPNYSIVVGGTPVTSGGAWVVDEP